MKIPNYRSRKKVRIENAEKRAIAYCAEVKPYFEEIPWYFDKRELLVGNQIRPLTKCRELLFTK